MSPHHSNEPLALREKPSSNKLSLHDTPTTPPSHPTIFKGDSADRVFHILELAQQIVYKLELKDLFRTLSITRDLWQSKVLDHVWAEHLERLGYPDYVVRETSKCLRTCYLSISQAVVAISQGVKPTSKLVRMKDLRVGDYEYIQCERIMGDMEPPALMCQTPRAFNYPGSLGRKRDLYTLDGGDLKLLMANVTEYPLGRICNGSSVVEEESDGSYVVRKLKDWSVTARFECSDMSVSGGERIWSFHDGFFFGNLGEWREPDESAWEVWDTQGLKLGPVTYSRSAQTTLDEVCHSNQGDHYLTRASRTHVKSWKLDPFGLVFERHLSAEDEAKGRFFGGAEGIVALLESCSDNDSEITYTETDKTYRLDNDVKCILVNHWSVDGRYVSKQVAAMFLECRFSPFKEFSDGTRVAAFLKFTAIFNKQGEVVKRLNLVHLPGDGYHVHIGILFDRLFFVLYFTYDGEAVSLIIYTKEGEELSSRTVDFRRKFPQYLWYIDILGRLVLMYDGLYQYLTEMEIIDFRGIQMDR